MEEITENWDVLLKSSKTRKWKAYLRTNPSVNNYIQYFVQNWVRNLISTSQYVQNEISKVDTLAYQKLVQNSQTERLEEILNWEEEHKDAFQLIQEFEKEALTNGSLLPSLKKTHGKESSEISSKKSNLFERKRKNNRQLN